MWSLDSSLKHDTIHVLWNWIKCLFLGDILNIVRGGENHFYITDCGIKMEFNVKKKITHTMYVKNHLPQKALKSIAYKKFTGAKANRIISMHLDIKLWY